MLALLTEYSMSFGFEVSLSLNDVIMQLFWYRWRIRS